MSFRGKRKDGEDHASDEDHAPPKKSSKTSASVDSDDSDDIVVCEISKNRRVSVRNWNGKIWVDIREFYLKDGKQLPGKKRYRLKSGSGMNYKVYAFYYDDYGDISLDLIFFWFSGMFYGTMQRKLTRHLLRTLRK
ncbi:hypothetical protein CRYUN_Cryun17cG0067900 [Craigia yunnanensis]